MKHTHPSLPHIPGADWRILGELELPAAADSDSAVRAWLVNLLDPLRLHADFQNKILRSAQEAAARLLNAQTEIKFEHIHLLILAPPNHAVKEGTWGFFHIEKVGQGGDHAIEFYLYLEGQ
ncbi:MAG: hypothetical protein DPW18_10910 [Chloroflexi bacterium]|nr:hypothetical protein [Chloroflexota bacterium]MDL1944184.1 hypothetical protein [Chloroflexi bacterium CFX2]